MKVNTFLMKVNTFLMKVNTFLMKVNTFLMKVIGEKRKQKIDTFLLNFLFN